MSVTASHAGAQLFPLIEQVNEDMEAVEIVSKKGTAFLVPAGPGPRCANTALGDIMGTAYEAWDMMRR